MLESKLQDGYKMKYTAIVRKHCTHNENGVLAKCCGMRHFPTFLSAQSRADVGSRPDAAQRL